MGIVSPQNDGGLAGDRRRSPRIPFDRPVRLQFGPPPDVITATTVDISTGGMFVRTTAFRQLGGTFDFTISAGDGGDPIVGSAEVVRVCGGDESEPPPGMSVRFMELRGNSAELVRRAVEAHLRT